MIVDGCAVWLCVDDNACSLLDFFFDGFEGSWKDDIFVDVMDDVCIIIFIGDKGWFCDVKGDSFEGVECRLDEFGFVVCDKE